MTERETIVRPIVPQPVLADPASPGRWIWGPTEPLIDATFKDGKMVDRGNWAVSWWNDDDNCDLMADHCPVDRPTKSKVLCTYDGQRWIWVITFTRAARKKHEAEKAAK